MPPARTLPAMALSSPSSPLGKEEDDAPPKFAAACRVTTLARGRILLQGESRGGGAGAGGGTIQVDTVPTLYGCRRRSERPTAHAHGERASDDGGHVASEPEDWHPLWRACPMATPEECQRFYDHAVVQQADGRKQRPQPSTSTSSITKLAQEQLTRYLRWRRIVFGVPMQEERSPRDSNNTGMDNAWQWAWDNAWHRYDVQCMGKGDDVFNVDTASLISAGKQQKLHHNLATQNKQQQQRRQRQSIPQYVFAYPCDEFRNRTCSQPASSTCNAADTVLTAEDTSSVNSSSGAPSESSRPPPPPSTSSSSSQLLALQVLPAQIDVHRACPAAVHAWAVASYLEVQFERSSVRQRADVWLDVRGAEGWPNPTPLQLRDLIVTLSHALLPLFPQRLRYLVVFPLPPWAAWLYKIISLALPKVIRERTKVVATAYNQTTMRQQNVAFTTKERYSSKQNGATTTRKNMRDRATAEESTLLSNMMQEIPEMSEALFEQMEQSLQRQVAVAAALAQIR